MVNVETPTSTRGQGSFYTAKHHNHSWAFLVMCDSFGLGRVVIGGAPGSTPEQDMLVFNSFWDNINMYAILKCVYCLQL